MNKLIDDKWNTIIERKNFHVAVMHLTDGPSRCGNNPIIRAESKIVKGICVSPRYAESLLTTEDMKILESYGFNPHGAYFVPGHVNQQENSSISYECKDGNFWAI